MAKDMSEAHCLIDGCSAPIQHKGMCLYHYHQDYCRRNPKSQRKAKPGDEAHWFIEPHYGDDLRALVPDYSTTFVAKGSFYADRWASPVACGGFVGLE
jgi:hypothetical protein